MLTAISNIYYRFYNDGDTEISERNQKKFDEGMTDYGKEIIPLLDNKDHLLQLYLCITSEALEDITNAIIQVGTKSRIKERCS